MSVVKNADAYERAVAAHLNELPDITATRPKVSTHYSDVLIGRGDQTAWLEVKMDHGAQIGSPRLFYQDGIWQSTGDYSPLKENLVDTLNTSESARDFIRELMDYTQTDDLCLPRGAGSIRSVPGAVPLETFRSFLEQREHRYLVREENVDISDLVRGHYTLGKREPVHYIASGDDFYTLSDEDPLGVPDDTPLFTARGSYHIRASCWSRFYEILPTIRVRSIQPSPYSVQPGSRKKNPFTI